MTFNPRPNFSEMEEEVLKFWEDNKIFQKTLEQTKDNEKFVFFEGPPTANGKPGIHHVEARSFKDFIPRYQTMRGKFVNRKGGWDTHGLPVELQVEKTLGISGKKQIESIKPTVRESIVEFNRLCKQSVWEYKEEWEKLTKRMGFWVDMERPYITYHNKYIETAWWALKQAWDKELVYMAHKVVPYCTRCGTALSSHEVAQGYKTVKDNSIFAKFKLVGQDETYILSWTTTPWTLPGNVALAVGKDISYIKVKIENEFYVLAKDLAEKVLENPFEVVEEFKGSEMVGWEYEPLFDVPSLKSDKSYKVYTADFVTTTDGTGVVHTAVMYGEDDYKLGEAIGLPKFHTVDESGKFISEVKELAGRLAKDEETEIEIFKYLKPRGFLLKKQKYEHEYPFCWRCNTPLLYYARDSWFIKMSSLRNELVQNNEQINWNPAYIKNGRFGQWLADAKDWAISRERYWGTPMPIWQCTSCKHHQVVGSVADLKLNKNHFLFGRHGESESVVQGMHINHPEPKPYPLTDLGRQQARAMGQKIKANGGVDMIFASDLTRTKETAELVSEIVGIEVQYDERLREFNMGIFNGHKLSDYHDAFPESKRWQSAPEGGETYMQLQNRVLDFVSEMNAKYTGKKILVVTHGDAIWLLNQYYDLPNTNYPDLGGYSEVDLSLTDLHRPYIDEVVLPCEKCGAESKRVLSVMDVWFDSAVMPYAQWHYPFENKELAESQFPADFISEAIDQTRGWFYTMLAVSTFLGKGPAYKNVISLGHLLDEKGQKMSKSKGNIIDPWIVINKQGIDSLRWFMYSINQPGDSKLFSERDLDVIVRKNFLTLWNVLSFHVTYSGFDKWTPENKTQDVDVLDKWILAKTQELVNEVTAGLDSFDAFRSTRKIEEFINELSTWYVRRSRERKGDAVYQTLHEVIKTLSLLMAPFTPFYAESIWQTIKTDDDVESVHLSKWPDVRDLNNEEKNLLKEMEVVRETANIGLNARKELAIPIRQPLATLSFLTKDGTQLPSELLNILLSELNVKNFDFTLKEGSGVKTFDGSGLVTKFYLNTEISEELKLEGLARNLERLVQDMRKNTGLKVGEMVNLSYDTEDEELKKALELFDKKKTFVSEIKAEKVENMESLEVDGKKLGLAILK